MPCCWCHLNLSTFLLQSNQVRAISRYPYSQVFWPLNKTSVQIIGIYFYSALQLNQHLPFFSVLFCRKKSKLNEQACLRLRPCTPTPHSWNSDLNLENFITAFLYTRDECKETFYLTFYLNQKFNWGHWYLFWNEMLQQKIFMW